MAPAAGKGAAPWDSPALRARPHWAADITKRLPGPRWVGMMEPALQSQQSLVPALLDVVAAAQRACDCPAQGGPLPAEGQPALLGLCPPCAVSSPPSKSVTHGASHIPQLQEIQQASAPAFLWPHRPPRRPALQCFSCSRASLSLPSFQSRGKSHPHVLPLGTDNSQPSSTQGCSRMGNAWPTASAREGLTWWQVVTWKGRRLLALAMHTSDKHPQSVTELLKAKGNLGMKHSEAKVMILPWRSTRCALTWPHPRVPRAASAVPAPQASCSPGFALPTATATPSSIPLPPPETPHYCTSALVPVPLYLGRVHARTPCLVSPATAPVVAPAQGSSRHPEHITAGLQRATTQLLALRKDFLSESHCTWCSWQRGPQGRLCEEKAACAMLALAHPWQGTAERRSQDGGTSVMKNMRQSPADRAQRRRCCRRWSRFPWRGPWQSKVYPCSLWGDHGGEVPERLQFTERTPCWSREQGEEKGVPNSNHYGLTAAPISQPLLCLGGEDVKGLGVKLYLRKRREGRCCFLTSQSILIGYRLVFPRLSLLCL